MQKEREEFLYYSHAHVPYTTINMIVYYKAVTIRSAYQGKDLSNAGAMTRAEWMIDEGAGPT